MEIPYSDASSSSFDGLARRFVVHSNKKATVGGALEPAALLLFYLFLLSFLCIPFGEEKKRRRIYIVVDQDPGHHDDAERKRIFFFFPHFLSFFRRMRAAYSLTGVIKSTPAPGSSRMLGG